MTSLTIQRNFAKNCDTGYKYVKLIYSNFLNNACDRCANGVVLSKVRCCNFLSNGFEYVKKLYILSDYCDAIEFNGVYGGAVEEGGNVFFTDENFYGDFSVRNVKMLYLSKIESMIQITGNKEVTKHCIVHVDKSVNKFLCKGNGNYKIVEYDRNLVKSIKMVPYSRNTEDIYTMSTKVSGKT